MKRLFFSILLIFLVFPAFASLQVHFVDVGQGDSVLINADGKWAIIDGADRNRSETLYNYVQKLGILNFDLIVLTHTDMDHVGGLPGAVQNKITKNTVVLCNDLSCGSRQYLSLKAMVNASDNSIREPLLGESFYLGSASITVIGPVQDNIYDKNNNSIVLRLDFKGKSFLFMGDAGRKSENQMINKYSSRGTSTNPYISSMLKADVLKAGHHGSAESTSYYFLNYVRPEITIISCGEGNQYHHPNEDILSRLIQSESTIYRTDYNGNIVVTVSDEGMLSTNTSKHYSEPWFDEDLLSSQQKALLNK